ncbi:hypothetical protein L6164_026462 [Bauhinia variegata]|uniref:Uncharacterized protein n=1 Tax=Bauhinia variegata TaxID=167791 RepID=A0ACB9LQG9_BAUVA|nr:hypothetical protein L6164_026462 [Bauhinia variegata]
MFDVGIELILEVPNPNGIFSIKSAYDLLSPPQSNKAIFELIWKTPCQKRIQRFLWKCANNALPIVESLFKRDILTDPSYWLCGEVETVLHCLRDCPKNKVLWRNLNCNLEFFNLDLEEWLLKPLKIFERKLLNIPWATIFSHML